MTQILVPTLGESVSEATVSQWLKKEGEAVSPDEPLVELETDKVTLEVNASEGGVLSKISVQEGETVEVGALLGEIAAGGSANENTAKAASAAPDTKSEKAAPDSAAPAAAPASGKDASGELSPAVLKLVNDNNLDASAISGTGKDGRLTKGDVLAFIESGGSQSKAQAPAASPTPTAAKSVANNSTPRKTGEREERVKMSRLRQSISRRLKEAQNTAAILTTFNEIDMTNVMELRKQYKEGFEKKHGIKLGFMSFFLKAAVQALKEFPAVNAEIDGDDIVYKNYYDIGVAVSTPQGLVVPVVRDTDQLSFAGVENAIMDYALKARDGKISIDDMTGGSFTVTNGGTFGSLLSTPILNTPQSAILGMHKTQKRPMVMPDGSIQARPMMYAALSYDHRIIDGKEAVSFLVRIKDAIEDPQRLLLDV